MMCEDRATSRAGVLDFGVPRTVLRRRCSDTAELTELTLDSNVKGPKNTRVRLRPVQRHEC